jgi:hypothetical protein
MESLYPETEESQASADGVAAHWAASELLSGRTIDVGLITENGVMLTDEMVDAAQIYADTVLSVSSGYKDSILHVEKRVGIDTIHPECWGTPDTWLFGGNTLFLWDFKFGHRFVDVFENWQLIEYAAGILESIGINGITDQHVTVQMTIVQPRCYVGGSPVRTWSVKAVDLRGYFNVARMFEERAIADDATTTVSPECRDCSARHACPAAQQAAYGAMSVASTSVPFDLPPDALGAELRYIENAVEMLEARKSGLEQQALALAKRGVGIPFYTAEQGYGRERWNKPDEEVIAMGNVMGVPLSVPKLVTPKQAIKAGMNEEIVKMYTVTPRGEVKLKRDEGGKARKIFGVVKSINC